MAANSITKHQVMAKCVYIMNAQLKDTNHPLMRERLKEKIDFLTTSGCAEDYQMIVYSNCITLIHNDYKNYPNFSLYDNGKLIIGRFDELLRVHDKQHIRIHGDGSADSGACVHGDVEGKCITNKRVIEKGKEVEYSYQSTDHHSAMFNRCKRVKNDNSLPLFKRLIYNETIGQKDYVMALLAIMCCGAVFVLFGLAILNLVLGIAMIVFSYKRLADAGYEGVTRIVLLVLALVFNMLGLVILSLLPSKVVSEREFNLSVDMHAKAQAQAADGLKRRCNSYSGSLEWFYVTSEINNMAEKLAAGASVKAPHNPYAGGGDFGGQQECEDDFSQPRGGGESAEARNREEAEAERTRHNDDIDRQIRSLESRLSSEQHAQSTAENKASSLRQQGETYLSYANSEQDESRRRDYLQSAESRFSEAAQYESDASSAASTIASLQSEINSLRSEMK